MLDWQKHAKLRILIRTICIVLIVTFLSYDLSWAGANEVLNPRNWLFAQKAQDSLSIEIPQELGLIKETFTSQYNPHKLVIHIQDAHANVEAQENEAKIIKYLKEKYNIHLVSVEGGFGDFDAGFFREFPKDKSVREKIAKYFLSKDFISGTDYLLVTEDQPPVVYGAEDKGLYESHLNTFKSNQGFSVSFNKSLSVFESAVQTLKNKYYSNDLREFDLHLADFKQGKSSLEEYLSYLNIVALLRNFDLSRFPNLYLIISLKELENKISFEKAEIERQALIDNLSKVLSKEGLEELVKKSIDFKANNLSAAEYYDYLEKLTQTSGISVKAYPNLFSYIKYISLSAKLDNTKIFAEIESFSQSVKERFTTSSAQKDIDSLTYIIGVLKGLSDIDLSPKDYEYFKSNRSTFTSKNIALILRRYLGSDTLSLLPTDEDITSLEKFYSIAHDRDSAIVRNSLSRLDKDYSSNSVILVAGGFHTQGITSALKEKNISYIVIAPNIKTSQEKESTYFSLLKDKKLPIEDILHDPDALQIINSITDPQARELLINYWVARSSRYYSPGELQVQLSNLILSGEDRKAVETALGEISGKAPEATPQETSLAQELPSKTPPATVVVPAISWANFDKFISSMLQKIRKFIIIALIFCTTACSSLAGTMHSTGIPVRSAVSNPGHTVIETVVPDKGSYKYMDYLRQQLAALKEQKKKVDIAYFSNLNRRDSILGEKGAERLLQHKVDPALISRINELRQQRETLIIQIDNLKKQIKNWHPITYLSSRVTAAVPSETAPEGVRPSVVTSNLSSVPDAQAQKSTQDKLSNSTHKEQAQEQETGSFQDINGRIHNMQKTLDRVDQHLDKAEKALAEINNSLAAQPQQVIEKSENRQETESKLTAQEEQARQETLKKAQEQEKTQAQLARAQEEQLKIQAQLAKAQDELAKANQEAITSQQEIEKLKIQQQETESKVTAQEEKNKTLETSLSNINERLDKAEKRISEIEKKPTDFKSYEKNWWQDQAGAWKAAFYLLAAFGIGIVSLRLFLYRRWLRLKTLKEEINNKLGERTELEKSLGVKREELNVFAKQIEAAKLSLAELEKQRASQEEAIKNAALELRRLQEESEKLRKANNLDTLTQEKERLTRAVEAIEKQITAKKGELSVLIDQEEAKLLALRSQVGQLEGEQAKYETAVQELKKKTDQYEAEVRALEQQKAKARQELAVLGDVSTVQGQVEEINKKIREAEETLRRLNSEVSSLGTQKQNLEVELAGYRADKTKLETGINALTQQQQKLTGEVSSLQAQKDSFIQKETQLRASIEAKAAELKGIEEKIALLQAQNQESVPQVTSLKAQKESLEKEIAKLSQYSADLARESAAKRSSLDKDISQKQSLSGELTLKISQLTAQQSQLEQEIGVLSTQKQKENQGLDTAKKEKETIAQEILLARQQIAQINTEITNLLSHVEELKQRGVNLDEEVPALTRRRDALQGELQELEKTRQQIQEDIAKAKKDNQPQAPQPSAVILPKPYAAMIFDVDNTLTDITTKIDKNLLELILSLLAQNVRIALVTVQSIDEVKEYIVEQVPKEKRGLLTNLTVYPSAGAKRFSFDAQGSPVNDQEYDTTAGLTLTVNPNEIKAAIQQVAGADAGVGLRDGAITITNLSSREETMGKLATLFKKEGWNLVPRVAGGHSIHLLIGGVDKGKAAAHFVKEVAAKAFNQEVPLRNVLVMGDSFYGGGLDSDLVSALEGADIVSVGRKPQGNRLRDLKAKGLFFSEDLVGIRNWQATFKILKEVIRGKTVREIGKKDTPGSSFSGTASILLALSTAIFSLFPTTISNAQMSLPGVSYSQSAQAPVETAQSTAKQLAEVFTLENYRGNVGTIDMAIKIISTEKIKDPKVLDGLKWTATTATLPENKYYPDTATNAVLALLKTDEGTKVLAEAIKDRIFIQQDTRFSNVLKTIGESKTDSPVILDALGWLMYDSSINEKNYSPYAVKLATETLLRMGDKAMQEIVDSFNLENYGKFNVRDEALNALAESKIRDPRVINKIYWLALEAVFDNGHYYVGYSCSAGKVLYQIEGNKALDKLTMALNDLIWRKSDGAAEAIIGIAKAQNGKLTPQIITALKEVQKLGIAHDYRQTAVKEAESILNQLPPEKIDFFTPQRYHDYPQKMILDANTFVANQNTNFINDMARVVVYAEGDGSFNQSVLKACVRSLLGLGGQGREALASILTPENYQKAPANLKSAIEIIGDSKITDPKIINRLAYMALEPSSSNGKYNPGLNKAAIQTVLKAGDNGAEALRYLFVSTNFRTKQAQLSLIADTLAENKDHSLDETLISTLTFSDGAGYVDASVRISIINALASLGVRGDITPLFSCLYSTDDGVRSTAIKALVNLHVPQDKIESFINSDNQLMKQSAREILKAIAPGRLEELTKPPVITPQTPLVQATQEETQKPEESWLSKIRNFNYGSLRVWAYVFSGLAILISGLVFYIRTQKVRAVYKQLLSYVGQTSFLERWRLKKASAILARKTHYDVDDVYKVIAEKLPEVYDTTKIERIEKIARFLDKLNKAKVNSSQILHYGIPFMNQTAKDEKQFDKGLDILVDTAKELQRNNINVDQIFAYSLGSINNYVREFSVFEAVCNLIKEMGLHKQNPQEILTTVAPEALRTAKDVNVKVARLNIILNLVLEGIYPTQLLIETLEKTTSQSNLSQEIAKWVQLLKDFKSEAVKFDVTNPVHVDLEYTTFRQLSSQISQSNSYENYKNIIQQVRSSPGSASGVGSQEESEIKLAVYEAYRLLDFIIAVKNKADKLGRPVWVVPNLSYGQFAVSPILDELGKLNIEVHTARIGSTECHSDPALVKQALFSDDVYLRILKERPVIIAVDGTQHLLARPEERKSARYPDAYVGYRNFIVAMDEVLSGKNDEKFQDKVKVDKDFLSTLRQNSEYTSLVDKLSSLNSGLGQSSSLYRLEFWNPGGLELVVREARKEVQNITPFNPDDLDSPALIFINSPLLDEDLPADIKQWAALEQPHVPAFFDDRAQIQQTVLAVNERGVYLSHALDFEISKDTRELKDSYKGKVPQIVHQPATPESLRSLYEAMLFDLDGTLTDTLSVIDKSLLNKLLNFLGSGVVVGIVTSQSIDEVEKNLLDQVDSSRAYVLQSLVVFTARGGQAWGFDQNKKPYPIYDRSQTDLNDAQRTLIRQLVTQALGSLAQDTQVVDRKAQITIPLKKNKDKRDLVNATLNQLIANNNLPFQTEYSGSSTIHVILKGVDKGTAKDYFLNQIIPNRLNHPVDLSKLLIVGDRFQEGGSDRPMIVQGARVVSVGGKDKTIPPNIESYSHNGWKGTNQLLGDIINRAGKSTVSLPSIIGMFGLSDFWNSLNEAGQGLFDTAKRPLLYLAIATLGVVFISVSIAVGVKLYKTNRIYSQIKDSISFLKPGDKLAVFKEISHRVSWKEGQDIDPYGLLLEILPLISKRTQDKRIQEMINTASRLEKLKINPRHVFKYMLPVIAAKTSNEKQFSHTLSLSESFAMALQDKRYDYHQLLKEIMPSLNRIVRNIDELNEAIFLGITLVSSGRNPILALSGMLPEVTALTKTPSEFTLGMYALQELCLEDFEPTKYLIAELIKQGTQAKIDQALSDWQETRRKFKTGDIAFNPKNPLHVNLEYTTFREFVDRTLKQQHKYNFSEYLSVLNNFNHNNTPAHVKAREKAEIKYAAYEAFRFRQFVLEVKQQADKMNRKVWVVPNLSYGRFAVSPLIKDLISDGIEIHYARIGSTESHENPTLVKADLFSPALYSRIINEQPVIIVVDGTQHLLARPKDRKSARYPDAYVGYRNMIVAANDVLSSGQEQLFKSLVKTNGSFIRRIREKGEYRTLRRRFLRVYNPNIKTKRYLYDVEFWNPGGLELAVREARQEVSRVRPISAPDITQPALIFANSVMLDEDIPVLIHDWIDKTKQIHHKPAYFDDKSNILNLIFNVDAFGVNLSDAMNVNMSKEYKRIKSIYRPSFNLPAKPQNLPNLPYKAVISDLDGTLSDTLQEIPKPVMEKLLYLLSLGIQIAIVTTQSYKEVEKYFLSQVPPQNKALLVNLTIYSATGSQAFGFDKNGNSLDRPLYDLAQAKLTDQQMQGWRQIIKSLLEEYALDQEVKDKKGQVVATPVKIIDAGSQIIIRLKERAFLRPQLIKRLQVSLNKEQLPITLKEIGRTSIRMTIRGIDKSSAVKYHLTKVCKDSFGFEPKPQEVLILGNSFDEDGDDRDMMIRGARVFSVGHKPAMHYLRGGVNFYSEHGWEGGDQVLAEFINIVSANLQAAPHKPAPQSATVNSFILPFLASTSLTGQSDSSTVWIVGCLALIIWVITIFKNKLFPPEEQDQEDNSYFENEPQADTTVTGKANILSLKQEVRVLPDNSRPQAIGFKQRDLENEFAVAETRIKQDYPGLKIGIIGAAMPAKGYSPEAGVALGRVLREYVAGGGFIFTGGVSGVGVDVYQGVIDASNGQADKFFVLLPEGMYAGREYRNISPSKQVKTANFGEDMFERRVGMGRVADVIIVLNGREGTLHEAISALRSKKKVIALDYGGAGSLLYEAKKNNSLAPFLIKSGLKTGDLDNIFLADITNIKEALNTVLANASITKEDLTRESEVIFTDPMSKALFNKSDTGDIVLSPQVISAINSLNEAYNGLTLEVDIDTLIDTSKGTPQLKGLGFKEALASLYQAQEKKQIPDNLKVRLININPSLNKEKIIKALGLTDDLLKGMVSIPEIPQDYLVKGLEPYLIQGSVRIIFEDNLRYWGKKVDVLVKRGKETETLSSIGLIVASLAKEPKFYESLPKDIKEYIVAKTDGKGKVELDDEGKIKQLIFKPIEKTKVDTQYLDSLDKANKELDGMV